MTHPSASASPKLFIFQCNSDTYLGCMEKSVFGSDKAWPLQVTQGDYCLLHHFEFGLLFGLWQATTSGGRGLVPKAWGGRFPYQVRIALVTPKAIEVPKPLIALFNVDPAKGRFDPVVEPVLAAKVINGLTSGR
jgi:hypothetical protein